MERSCQHDEQYSTMPRDPIATGDPSVTSLSFCARGKRGSHVTQSTLFAGEGCDDHSPVDEADNHVNHYANSDCDVAKFLGLRRGLFCAGDRLKLKAASNRSSITHQVTTN